MKHKIILVVGVILGIAMTRAMLARAMAVWDENPGMFGEQVLGSDRRTDYQKETIETMLLNDYVCVKSANAMGKTFTLADAMIEAFYVHGYKHGRECYIIATAPDYNIIKNVLFSEIRKKHAGARVPLGGQANLTEIKITDKWHMLGFSPRKSVSTDASNMQGFHAALVIIVLEEATGISRELIDRAKSMTTTGHVKIWAIGNPTDGNTAFGDMFKDFRFKKITWDCFKSPNLIANDIKKADDIKRELEKIKCMPSDDARMLYLRSYLMPRPELLTARSVIEQALEYGIDSPVFTGRVLAEFPSEAVNTLAPVWRVEECMTDGDIDGKNIERVFNAAVAIGVDVARFGDDNTEISVMRGNEEIARKTFVKADTVAVYNYVREQALYYLDNASKIIIGVDATGIGSGVFDQLNNDYALSNNTNVTLYQINFGANAVEENKYVNLISEMADYTRKKIISPQGIILPKDYSLLNEITNRRFKYDIKSRFWLESKQDYKSRNGGKSPDRFDAVVIAQGCYMLSEKYGATATFNHDNSHNAVSYKNADW